ncbi:MAG: AAA family ATPase, partial [Micromonosporaceae bacterium]|nr:AAA family ATPase [Micromonosporaceae bacterium]
MSERSPARVASLRGRVAEREAVVSLIDQARAGCGGVLVIEGGPGIGKTCLADDVLAEIQAGSSPPPLVLGTRARRREASLPFATADALFAPVIGPSWRAMSVAAIEGGDVYRLGAHALETLATLARRRPVVCWVDDAQWSDPRSVDLLGFVAGRLAAHRVAVLIAQRPGGPDWEFPTLRLAPLDPADGTALVADLAPGIDGDVARALVALAAGNPGALADLASALTPAQRRGEEPVPQTLPASSRLRRDYAARLAAMPEPTRRLVLVAAADPSLTTGELVRAAESMGVDITAVDPAERDGLIRISGDEVQIPEPLARCVVYEEATLSARRATHALLASILDPHRSAVRTLLHRAALAVGPDPDLAEALAECVLAPAGCTANRATVQNGQTPAVRALALVRAAELSIDPALAAIRLVAAARQLWDGGEPHRARGLLRRVQAAALPPEARGEYDLLLGEMELRGRTPDRAGAVLLTAAEELRDNRHRRVTALLSAGEALCLAGDYPEFGALADRALALRRPSEPREAEFAFEQLAGLTAMFRGDYQAAAPSLRRVIALATAIDEPTALVRASMAAIVLGDDEVAYRLAMRAATLAEAEGWQAAVPRALEVAAAAECALGRYTAAAATLARAIPLASATGQQSLHSNLAGLLAVIAAMLGDRDTCRARIREARAGEVSRAAALVEWALGILDLNDGRAAEAVPRLAGLCSIESGHGQLIVRVAATPHLVEACVRSGDPGAAREALAIFDPWARQTGNPAWLALSERCRALVAEDPDRAGEHFRTALHQHQRARARFERARTQLLYGQELRRMRRRSAAREQLRAAYETFEYFGATPLAEQARAELRAAGERVAARPGHVHPISRLTAQQRQIAELVASGATNREIAAALFVSTRTVDYHVRNILARLGLRSRIDLARMLAPSRGGGAAGPAAAPPRAAA